MFDNLIQGEDKPSMTEALLKLLDSDNRESKTILEMSHIKFLLKSKWLFLKKEYPEKSIIWRQNVLMEYYLNLKPSYKGISWEKIVEGIKEMKPQLVDGQMMAQQK